MEFLRINRRSSRLFVMSRDPLIALILLLIDSRQGLSLSATQLGGFISYSGKKNVPSTTTLRHISVCGMYVKYWRWGRSHSEEYTTIIVCNTHIYYSGNNQCVIRFISSTTWQREITLSIVAMSTHCDLYSYF